MLPHHHIKSYFVKPLNQSFVTICTLLLFLTSALDCKYPLAPPPSFPLLIVESCSGPLPLHDVKMMSFTPSLSLSFSLYLTHSLFLLSYSAKHESNYAIDSSEKRLCVDMPCLHCKQKDWKSYKPELFVVKKY